MRDCEIATAMQRPWTRHMAHRPVRSYRLGAERVLELTGARCRNSPESCESYVQLSGVCTELYVFEGGSALHFWTW